VSTFAFSPRRVGAMILRHIYLLRSSWPRLFELVYWPAVQMFLWGFLQIGIAKYPGALAGTASTFLAAFLLWDILFRGQIGYSMSFLEETCSSSEPARTGVATTGNSPRASRVSRSSVRPAAR
jgi:ABC-2 type transport system permease protein